MIRSTPRRGPARDADYLDWIRRLPCVCCTLNWPVNSDLALAIVEGAEYGNTRSEAAHVGERGLGQKCSDYETIPLCGNHHRVNPVSHHRVPRGFWIFFGIDREDLIIRLRMLYGNKER